MGDVLWLRRHWAATVVKSLAVTRSPVAMDIATASSLDSHTLPRRKRDTVVRSHETPAERINEAISSSSNPLLAMNFDNCMTGNVHYVHNQVKPICAYGPVGAPCDSVHILHMAKNSLKMKPAQHQAVKTKAPSPFKRTFLREYRKEAGLNQTKAAIAFGYEDHSTLSKIETGKLGYTQELLEAASVLYKTSIWQILYCPPKTSLDQAVDIWRQSIKLPK